MKKLWLLGLLIGPLISGNLLSTIVSSKILFLQIFVLIGILLNFKESLNLNKFLLSLVGLLLWASLSSFWATDSLLSWTGQYWRGTGLIFYYAILCLLLTQKSDESFKELLRKSFLFLALLISVVTSAHFIFIKGSPSFLFTGNQNSTALILGCAILLFIKDQLFKSKVLNSLFAFQLTLGLFLTGSRSGLISLILCSSFYCFFNRKDLINKVLIAGASSFSLVLIHYFFISPEFLTTIFLKTQNFSRLKIWPGAFNSFLDKPVLGWGFQGLYDGFWSHYPDSMGSTFQWIDNAHSLPLNVLSELGIIGFSIMLCSLYFLYKEVKESPEKSFWLSYSLFIFAYLLVQPVYIDSILVMAISYVLFSKTNHEIKVPKNIEAPIKSISALALLVVCFIQLGQNFNLHQAKSALTNSKDYRPFWKEFSNSSFKLIDPQGSLLELSSTFNSILRNPNISQPDKKIFSKLILDEFKKLEETSFHRPRYLDMYGVWLMRSNYLEEANNIFDMVLKRSPNNSQILILKAESEALRGYRNNSIELFEKAEKLTPNNIELKMNLAKLYMELGYKEKAISKIKEASALDPTNIKIKEILKQF